jgi:hypothetical protein
MLLSHVRLPAMRAQVKHLLKEASARNKLLVLGVKSDTNNASQRADDGDATGATSAAAKRFFHEADNLLALLSPAADTPDTSTAEVAEVTKAREAHGNLAGTTSTGRLLSRGSRRSLGTYNLQLKKQAIRLYERGINTPCW